LIGALISLPSHDRVVGKYWERAFVAIMGAFDDLQTECLMVDIQVVFSQDLFKIAAAQRKAHLRTATR